jgi:hypothetical protein
MASTLRAKVCLVHGRHTPRSDWAKECPVRRAASRSERSKNAWASRKGLDKGRMATNP